jgi:hypothetical protein
MLHVIHEGIDQQKSSAARSLEVLGIRGVSQTRNIESLTIVSNSERGRFIGRIHALGATKKFEHRTTLNIETLAIKPRAFLLDNELTGSSRSEFMGQRLESTVSGPLCFNFE